MNKNIKRISVVCLCILLSGCSMFQSAFNDIKGNLVGNGYTIYIHMIIMAVKSWRLVVIKLVLRVMQ